MSNPMPSIIARLRLSPNQQTNRQQQQQRRRFSLSKIFKNFWRLKTFFSHSALSLAAS
jgi:hypothetical protein